MAVEGVASVVSIVLIEDVVIAGILVKVVFNVLVVLVDKENKTLTVWELLSDKL